MAVPQFAAGWRRPPHFGVCDVPKGHVLALASTDFNAGARRTCPTVPSTAEVHALSKSRGGSRTPATSALPRFVADLHQPLHDEDNGDKGGNKRQVIFDGHPGNLRAVALNDIGAECGTAAMREILKAGGSAHFYHGDVSRVGDSIALIDWPCAFERVDILVNNASLQYIAPLKEFPLEEWRRLIGVMLTGTFLATKFCFPDAGLAQGPGRIINIVVYLCTGVAQGISGSAVPIDCSWTAR